MTGISPPLALLAELTHRCPLGCAYCSNPIELERASGELPTADWVRIIREAAALGCLQIHFSGGEPSVRADLDILVAAAAQVGLYTNLITSGVLLDAARVASLVAAGLEHVQLSFQDAGAETADRLAYHAGAHAKKLEAARLVVAADLPLTTNFVLHRQNCAHLDQMIELALALGAHRIELANVQYYGWALKNRAALLPSQAQLDRITETIEAARTRLKGVTIIDYVVPDYYARRPKSCMGGWGQRFLNVSPSGKVLPCHAAETLPGLVFENAHTRSLRDIWHDSAAFNQFRSTGWMREPCRSCDRRELDWGGCRCQAFALTADAAKTDPACALSEDHFRLTELTLAADREGNVETTPRRFISANSARRRDQTRSHRP